MFKSFVAGFLVLSVLAVVSSVTKNPSVFQNGSLILGLAGFAGAGLLSGAFVSGDRNRANVGTEDDADRQDRQKWAGKLFLFGLPLFIAALVSYGVL